MEIFADFSAGIDDPLHRERTEEVLTWINNKYPNLEKVVKWNQPMFTDHGTFIIGFSVSKKHLAVSPEEQTISHLEDEIMKTGYSYTKGLIRIPWNGPVDYTLLEKMIEFNIWDKANCSTFWRK